MVDAGVTPAPVSRLQLKIRKAKQAIRVILRRKTPGSCRICEQLLFWLAPDRCVSDRTQASQYDAAGPVINLGTVEEALTSPCSQHTLIVKLFQWEFEDDLRCGYNARPDRGVRLTKQDKDVVRIQAPSTDRSTMVSTLVLADNPKTGHRGYMRVLDRE
jgi:hypothetical protein